MVNDYCAMSPNRLFTPQMLQVALAPETWRLVSSALPPEMPTVRDDAHREWMAGNSHCHAHREVLLVLSGEPHFGLDGRVYASAPGTVFVLGAFEPHDLEWPPWTPDSDHLWMGIIGREVGGRVLSIREGLLTAQGTEHLLLHEPEVAGSSALTEGMGRRDLPALARTRLLVALAGIVTSLVERGFEVEEPLAGDVQRRTVQAVRRYIEETAGRGVTLDGLARFSGYSKYHLLRLFQRHMGLTIHQYVDQCRLRRVRELRTEGATDARIGRELGFSSAPSFSRWLKLRGER